MTTLRLSHLFASSSAAVAALLLARCGPTTAVSPSPAGGTAPPPASASAGQPTAGQAATSAPASSESPPSLACPAGARRATAELEGRRGECCEAVGSDGRWRRHGPAVLRRADGTLALTGQYIDGVRHGRWQQVGRDGRVLGTVTLERGNGMWTEWHDGGAKKLSVELRDDQRHGPYHEWFPNGQLAVEGSYDAGQPSGTWTRYYENGTKQSVESYRDGQLYGRQRTWFPSGAKQYEGHWLRGKRHGLCTWWRDNGHRYVQGRYREGKQFGVWYVWGEDGKPIVRAEQGLAGGWDPSVSARMPPEVLAKP